MINHNHWTIRGPLGSIQNSVIQRETGFSIESASNRIKIGQNRAKLWCFWWLYIITTMAAENKSEPSCNSDTASHIRRCGKNVKGAYGYGTYGAPQLVKIGAKLGLQHFFLNKNYGYGYMGKNKIAAPRIQQIGRSIGHAGHQVLMDPTCNNLPTTFLPTTLLSSTHG